MTIKLIIFDFDGVLVDSEYIAGQVTTAHLLKYGVEADLDTTLKRFVGMHDTDMRKHLAPNVGADNVDRFLSEIKQLSLEAYHQRLAPMANAIAMLESLTMPICIGSNSRFSSLITKLKITKLDKFFAEDKLYVGSMVAKPKPAPDLYLHAAAQHNVAADECLVIEDSAHGVKAAVDAKMPVIGYHGASHCYAGYEQKLLDAGAQMLFDDLADIPNIISNY
ncbi:MAG: HAD-IA family hydrolase [Rhizobiales bacterium]|nr:HAD-IA family hydrolase [Hyphomicrobiales bacterium]NRB13481.1 HAD-IA family hydrolase [Hyphomicrobiales bacterium]